MKYQFKKKCKINNSNSTQLIKHNFGLDLDKLKFQLENLGLISN